jgi:hypothetical protein
MGGQGQQGPARAWVLPPHLSSSLGFAPLKPPGKPAIAERACSARHSHKDSQVIAPASGWSGMQGQKSWKTGSRLQVGALPGHGPSTQSCQSPAPPCRLQLGLVYSEGHQGERLPSSPRHRFRPNSHTRTAKGWIEAEKVQNAKRRQKTIVLAMAWGSFAVCPEASQVPFLGFCFLLLKMEEELSGLHPGVNGWN